MRNVDIILMLSADINKFEDTFKIYFWENSVLEPHVAKCD